MFDRENSSNIDDFYRIENNKRIYNGSNSDAILFTYNEIYLHFLEYMNIGTKIFFLYGKPNCLITLNSGEIDYLYKLGSRFSEPLKFFFSKNIKNIKINQRSDLFFLTNLKNCEFVYLLPQLDENNYFYFNLIIGVKSNFNITQFYKWNLKSIVIKNIFEINFLNINFNLIKKLFNFEKNKFRDNSACWEEYRISYNFENNQKNLNKYKKETLNKIIKRLEYKFLFKRITNHCYWYDDKIIKKDSFYFYIDYGWDSSKILNKDYENVIHLQHEYMFVGGLKDIFSYNSEIINFDWLVLNKSL